MNALVIVLVGAIALVSARPQSSDAISRRQAVNGSSPCGNLGFSTFSGFIKTPNYPQNYGNGMSCVYTIQPQNISSFGVNFKACDCYLEHESNCGWDFLKFGNSNRTCGDVSGNVYHAQSVNGKVEVAFYSDGSVTKRGCNIAYFVGGSTPSCPVVATTTSTWNNFTWNNFSTTPSWNWTTSAWNWTTTSWNWTTSSWNWTTPSWNWTTPSWNTSTPSWNATTIPPSNASIYDLLNIMYSKQWAVENLFTEYRGAVENVINRLMYP